MINEKYQMTLDDTLVLRSISILNYEKKEVSLKFRKFMKRHADKLWLLLLPDHACSE